MFIAAFFFFYNSQGMEVTEVPVNRQVDKDTHTLTHTHTPRILLSHKIKNKITNLQQHGWTSRVLSLVK